MKFRRNLRMWKPIILILIILVLLLVVSCVKQQNKKVTFQKDTGTTDSSISLKSSSTLVCWKTSDSTHDLEDDIKKVFKSLGIDCKDLDSQQWNPKDSTISGVRDYKLSKVASAGTSWNCILLHLNSQLGEKLSIELSKSQKTTVITFLEFHQIAWGYCLYQNGRLVDQFCNDPEEIEEEAAAYKGSIDTLIKTFNTEESKIEPYLKHISEIKNSTKAFPGDEFTLDNHWVRVDFMKKLGLTYPDNGKWIYIVEKDINDR